MSSVISWLLGSGDPHAAATLDPMDDRYYDNWTGHITRSGVRMSADTARKVSAVYRCVSILSNLLAMFPKGIYEKLETGRREAPEHPLDPIISFKPNRRHTAFEFWQIVSHHLVLRQNAFVQIVQGPPGQGWVGELVPLHPDRVFGPKEMDNGSLVYEYHRGDGRKFILTGGIDIWHIRGLSEDGLRGLSLIDLADDSFGMALAAERHAARFFDRGIRVAGILQSEKTLKPQIAEEMGESFSRKWGGEHAAGKVPVLWEGVKFQPVSMTPKDAEFLESRKFSVADIARWFGIPPHLIGDVERSTSWGSGLAEQNLGFLIFTIQPWIELLQQAIRFTLIVQAQRYYAKFNPGALMQMDPKSQAEVFDKLIGKGVLNPNECRELLERNPREGGDDFVNPAQNVARSPSEVSGRPEPEDEEEDEEETEAARVQRLSAARMQELLAEEEAGLVRLAKRHSKTTKAWRAAIAGFYGRFARRIESTGICTLGRALEWCAARRDLVLNNGGLFKLAEGTSASDEALLGGDHAKG